VHVLAMGRGQAAGQDQQPDREHPNPSERIQNRGDAADAGWLPWTSAVIQEVTPKAIGTPLAYGHSRHSLRV
jgi:hypothetical protein